ncbi:hypothetical protein TKK_0002867 [Trichogramma kaykai]
MRARSHLQGGISSERITHSLPTSICTSFLCHFGRSCRLCKYSVDHQDQNCSYMFLSSCIRDRREIGTSNVEGSGRVLNEVPRKKCAGVNGVKSEGSSVSG